MGIRTTHSEFGGRAKFGVNTVGGDDEDKVGHGTHVAGIIGGSTFGVAKKTTLISVIVTSPNAGGTWASVVAGVDWIVADYQNKGKPKSIANISLGGGGNLSIDNAVAQAIEGGIVFTLAAGNSNDDACKYSPGRVTTALTAAATNSADTRAYFSNWGSCVDLFAPGLNITSAWHLSDTANITLSGSSFSAPHLAGAIALYLGHITTSPTPKEIHEWINKQATYDIVIDPRTSPNRLLYSPTEDQ